jgi:hypothetical protein
LADSSHPLLVIYIVWHPAFDAGEVIAEGLRKHFRRELYENISGGTGLSVLFRSVVAPGLDAPSIDLDEAHATAIVVLADNHLTSDAAWLQYVHTLVDQTETAGLNTRVFPVAIQQAALQALAVAEQAIRWDRWTEAEQDRLQHLIRELAYQFSRMLRHYLESLQHPNESDEALEAYLKKVQIFLSHSKHDDEGVAVAQSIRDTLHASNGLDSFFDVHDIPAGLRFNKVLLQRVRTSAMVAIHTDSYSSREWCRLELIEAKRWNVPLVIANCLKEMDERGFPYMGNVPVVRLNSNGVDRINVVIGRLLDEVLKDFLWRCRVQLSLELAGQAVMFVPRPPELIMLASLPRADIAPSPLIVYPDPPLSAEEERLFESIAPHVQLRSHTEWLAGAVR